MLDNLRNFATTIPGKILGVFLLIGLAGFGITGVLTSIGSNTVARVGDQEITIRDFQTAYQAQINAAAAQLGTVPTPDQAISLGIPSQVISQLSTDAALNILGEELGLGVSDKRLAEGLRSVSAFAGTLGTFDRDVFEQVLRQNNITEKEYFDTRREAAKRQQIAQALFAQTPAPKVLGEIVQRYGEDRRILEYFLVSELSLLPISAPEDDVLEAYLEANQFLYRTEEMRTIRAIQLSPEVLAKNIDISDEEIAAEYERTKQSLVRPERREIKQVSFSSDEMVEQFQAAIADGKNFEEAATLLDLEVSELGRLLKRDILDQRLAEVAFGVDLNEVAVGPSAVGQRAIIVTDIEPARTMTLAQARRQIAQRLALARGREQFIDVLDQIEEQRAAFIDLDKTAEEFDLPLVEVAISVRGEELVEPLNLDPAEAERIANAVFRSEIGALAAMATLGANKSVWYDLIDIEEARNQDLEEVREELVAAWIAEQRANALEEKANGFAEQLKSGQNLQDIAVINGLFPVFSQPLSRGGDGSADIDANVAAVAFLGGEDHTGTAQNGNGDYVVFRVSSVIPAEEPLAPEDQDFIEANYRDNLFSDFSIALRDDAKLSINQGVLNQVLGFGPNGSSQPGGGLN